MEIADREIVGYLVRRAKEGDKEAFSELVRSMMKEVVAKDRIRTPRRAGACLPPTGGGRKARRYAEFETALLESMCSPRESNGLISQPHYELDKKDDFEQRNNP